MTRFGKPEHGVYFLFGECSGLTKIGIGHPIASRVSGLRMTSGEPLRLVAAIITDDARPWEETLHRVAHDRRMHGEWFDILLPSIPELVENAAHELQWKYATVGPWRLETTGFLFENAVTGKIERIAWGPSAVQSLAMSLALMGRWNKRLEAENADLKARERERRIATIKRDMTGGVHIPCLTCGQMFNTNVHRYLKRGKRFCSRPCQAAYKARFGRDAKVQDAELIGSAS